MSKYFFKHWLSGMMILAVFLFLPVSGLSRDIISMYLGEVSVLEIGVVERVAIGNPKVASNSILPNGQVVLLADAVGVTSVHIWLKDGTEKDLEIQVREKKILDNYQELTGLLKNIPGVSSIKVGDLVVVKGRVPSGEREIYNRIMERFKGKEVLDLVRNKPVSGDIGKLLEGFPNVKVQEVDGKTVVTGEVDKEYAALIQILQAQYPSILNLTRTQSAVAGKMVYMKVRIMEVSKQIEEHLGINWNVLKMPGPSLEFGLETTWNGGTILNAAGTSKTLTKSGNTSLTTATGYFGIATGITSFLNLAETNGDAVTLAEPYLSARSGGKAQFLAGGEYPMPVTSAQGQVTVQFKKYGIVLDISPTVDSRSNILAHIQTEVSTIDPDNSVAGIPALKSRKTSTDVSLRPRETLVIAGLLNEIAGKDYDNVKWLSELPVLGPLFKSKHFIANRSELVIFVTPYIYDVNSEQNREGMEKVKQMEETYKEIVKGNELME